MSSKGSRNLLEVVIIAVLAVVLPNPLSSIGAFGMMEPWMMGFGFA